MTLSLNTRLLLAGSMVLSAFLGVTGLVLDSAFRASADGALRDRLQGHVYAMLAASDFDAQGALHLPVELPEPRFSLIGSGLYAEVTDDRGRPVWRSLSQLGLNIPFRATPAVGEREFVPLAVERDLPLLSLAFTVSWVTPTNREFRYTYRVAENLLGRNAEVSRFRRSLWGWLAGAAVLLLLAQALILRWSLAPLRRVAEDVRALETGLETRLAGDYPRELRTLTDNLNALLVSADSRLQHTRAALGNLAHSLKTPLAVLHGAVDGNSSNAELRELAREQLSHMAQLIEFQLQRAAVSGRSPLSTPVGIRAIVDKIVPALLKVYADKRLDVRIDIAADCVFHGDAGDLTEVLGNLLDNACKWCQHQVRITARAAATNAPEQLEIRVDDDGPGIAPELKARVLERGARGDTGVPGHGLGLAMVQDTVARYRGTLALQESPLGGLLVCLHFPTH